MGVEKEVTDPWCPDCPPRKEWFNYVISGGSKDPNVLTPGTCSTGTVTATIPQRDNQGFTEFDPTTGQPVTTTVTFTAVDGDCNATNSWASDQDFGNDPWPQDGDTIKTNDPMPYNDSNLSNPDNVLSNDELWSNSESYYVQSTSGTWTDEVGTKYAEITGPRGWPYPYDSNPNDNNFVQDLIDYNSDGDNNPNTTGSRHLERVFVDFSGTLITSGTTLQTMWQDQQGTGTMIPIPMRFRVLASNLSIPQGEQFDFEADWWLMNDDDGDCATNNYSNCIDEDPVDLVDNDSDGKIDEDPQFSQFDGTDWGKLMAETTDAVVDHYYVITTDTLTIDPTRLTVSGTSAQGVIIDDVTETWSPHPPYDPNNPDRADLNGDGVVDDKDNSVTFREHLAAGFKKVADSWLLARLAFTGENGTVDTHFVANPIDPVSPAPDFTTGSFPQPPTNVGTTPTFEWSYPDATLAADLQSLAVVVMEMSEPTATSPPQPVAGRIIMLSGSATSYIYGSGTGTDVTTLVMQNVTDLPFSTALTGNLTAPLEAGKAYMWMVVGFKVAADQIFVTDSDPIAESFPVIFATTTMPSGFATMNKDNAISGASMKVQL
jgi:hypothetical protein